MFLGKSWQEKVEEIEGEMPEDVGAIVVTALDENACKLDLVTTYLNMNVYVVEFVL